MRPLPLIALLLGLAVGVAACGGGGDLDAARFYFKLGQLENAEARLAGVEGRGADDLRAAIEAAWAARAALEEDLRLFREALDDQPREELLGTLRKKLVETDDPVAEAVIERELSYTEDWIANRDQVGFHKKIWLPGLGLRRPGADDPPAALASPSVPAGPVTFDPLLTQVLEEVRQATFEKVWRRALASLDMALEDTPAATEHVLAQRADVLARAVKDGRKLLQQAEDTERARGLDAAHVLLLAELWRFPTEGPAGIVAARAEELEHAIDALEGPTLAGPERPPAVDAEPPDVAPTPVQVARDEDANELALRASRAVTAGNLADAATLYREASQRAWGASVDVYALHARGAEARDALRVALADAYGRDAAPFAVAGFEGVDAHGVQRDGAVVPWRALDAGSLAALAALAPDVPATRLGLVLELLERGALDGASGAHARLQGLLKRGELPARDVDALVARSRDEAVPRGGYVWHDGRFLTAAEHDELVIGAEAKRLARALETRRGDAREAAYAALFELSLEHPYADAALSASLEKLFDKAVQGLTRASTLRNLQNLAAARRELDERRSFALELIFDESKYFYPYKPPAVSSERASQYAAVQREVDERVAEVRGLWESALRVKLPASFRDELSDLRWTLDRAQGFVPDIQLPERLPEWVLAIDTELDVLTLASFAWDEAERARIARDRAVRARSERLWAEHAVPSPDTNQVRITNNYRAMLGRDALAWNPHIHEAASMHSEYMANSGHFGHYEEGDVQRRSPFDRMRLTGYSSPSGENCHMGSSGAEGAHNGWVHSSGHHRTLLSTQHTEMASALSTYYWTQNFGRGTEFERELER
jgi:hypothetical protein